jgi:hypothetical protein
MTVNDVGLSVQCRACPTCILSIAWHQRVFSTIPTPRSPDATVRTALATVGRERRQPDLGRRTGRVGFAAPQHRGGWTRGQRET